MRSGYLFAGLFALTVLAEGPSAGDLAKFILTDAEIASKCSASIAKEAGRRLRRSVPGKKPPFPLL